MICPKCDTGNVCKIIFKSTSKKGSLCDLCGTLWFSGEIIDTNTGHKAQSFSRGEELEYVVEEIEEGGEKKYD